jgi:hypothetical protein
LRVTQVKRASTVPLDSAVNYTVSLSRGRSFYGDSSLPSLARPAV